MVRLSALFAVLAVASCAATAPELDAATVTAALATKADVTVLMMGNSHTTGQGLPQQLALLLQSGLGGRKVLVAVAPGWMFLDERLKDAGSIDLLRGRAWAAVVLQAQKYSSSGRFAYSTEETEALIRLVRGLGASPVLFPEWPRRGVAETRRIHELHVAMARKEGACVAPVGQAWDLALKRYPTLLLHAADGNHASAAGAFLTALVLYATLSGGSPAGAPVLPNGVAPELQSRLRQVAAARALLDQAQASYPGFSRSSLRNSAGQAS